MDTLTAVNYLCRQYHLKNNAISFAGTKDKRAITVQKCTVYRKKPSEMTKVNNQDHPFMIRVGDFEYVREDLKIGSNSGACLLALCVLYMKHGAVGSCELDQDRNVVVVNHLVPTCVLLYVPSTNTNLTHAYVPIRYR